MTTWYIYAHPYQNASWNPYLADDYEQVVAQGNRFTTALKLNKTWAKGEKMPEGVKYTGDWFIDWDGKDIEDVIGAVKRFANKIESKGVNCNQLRWWLTGGKGVHCVIPMELYLSEKDAKKLRKDGNEHLPVVYRGMTSHEEFLTDYMDQSIYSGGKGRMWRVPNVERVDREGNNPSGLYKVPISYADLRQITETSYWEWCSQPRPEVLVEPPEYNAQMGILFNTVLQKVESAVKSNKRTKPVDFSAWKELPPTLKEVFDGSGIDHSQNLNDIKMQLCIAAAATQFRRHSDEDAFIESIRGFIRERAKVPGTSHKTESSIEHEMRMGFRSVVANPCYSYSTTALNKILLPDYRDRPDLSGEKESEDVMAARINQGELDMVGNMRADDLGVQEYVKGKDGDFDRLHTICNYSWSSEGAMARITDKTGRVVGHLVTPLVRGKPLPKTIVTIDEQLNTTKMQRHIMSLGGHLEGVNSRALSQIKMAWHSFANQTYDDCPNVEATAIEGLFVRLRNPDESDDWVLESDRDYNSMFELFWIESTKTTPSKVNRDKALQEPMYLDPNNPEGRFGIDLSKARVTLADTQTPMKEPIRHLLELNGNFFAMSAIIGWTVCCLLKQPLFLAGKMKNYPILQVYGDQGCGKTTTMNTIMRMFSWKQPFRVTPAGSVTPAALKSLSEGSMSIPLIIDEVKFQNLAADRLKALRDFMQNIYTIGGMGTKAGGHSEGSHHNGLVREPAYAPMAFIGETLETSQASLMERITAVGFHTSDKHGRKEHVEYLQANSRTLGVLGWTLVQEVLNYDMGQLMRDYEHIRAETSRTMSGNADRVVENAQAIILGFDFFCKTLRKYFPGEFDEKLEAMMHALKTPSRWERDTPSEVVRVLRLLSQASYETEYHYGRAIAGHHYELTSGDGGSEMLIISCDRMYVLYRERMARTKEQAVYSASEEFFHALKNSSLTIDAFDHPNLGPNCVKLSGELMRKGGIHMFKG